MFLQPSNLFLHLAPLSVRMQLQERDKFVNCLAVRNDAFESEKCGISATEIPSKLKINTPGKPARR